MYDVSKNYCNEDATKTELAARIIEAHQQKSEEMERSRQIKDIRPSEEDLRIAQRTASQKETPPYGGVSFGFVTTHKKYFPSLTVFVEKRFRRW